MKQGRFLIIAAALATMPLAASALEADSIAPEPKNELSLDADLKYRGELRRGGLINKRIDDKADNNKAQFITGRTRLGITYKRDNFLELRINAQHSGIWGQAGKGGFNLYEAYAKLTARNGLFLKAGRQTFIYDDERILGNNDWSMAAMSHDAVLAGYEGHGHKLHLIGTFNQNAANVNGGTYYNSTDGAEPFKGLFTLWYHYDFKRVPLGISALFMNMRMQNDSEDNHKTENQQIAGTYITFEPRRFVFEGSFYYQFGKDEFHVPIKAWMMSFKGTYDPTPQWTPYCGYDYLSGDPNPVVPKIGGIGMAQHTVVRGFSPVYGSHHQFYGAMEFFYLGAFYGGYTPGLQNLYAGTEWRPFKGFEAEASYHYYATATKISDAARTLGHEMRLELSYSITDYVKASIGYTYMHGTSTLERMRQVPGNQSLHWAWLMLQINPTIITHRW